MKKYLYSGEGNIYKANLHCHTTVSDGALTPKEIKEMYKARGYSIVAYTDHGILKPHGYLNDENFLAINACEMGLAQSISEAGSENLRKVYHFNLYATRPEISAAPRPMTMDYNDSDAINRYIADRVNEGFLVCYNHPHWSLQQLDDYGRLKGCFAMEIYNHNCEAADGFSGYHHRAYDEMLRSGIKLFCVSVDDNHNYEPSYLPDKDSFGGFVYVNSKSLSYEDVMDSLKAGSFYSSQGPEIYEISLNEDILTIKSSPVQAIRVYTQGRIGYEHQGNGITEASFRLRGDEGYIRAVCRDKNHAEANSNAYWLYRNAAYSAGAADERRM